MVFFLAAGMAASQDHAAAYIKGYAEEISGKRFTYHSPFPEVNEALIIWGRADFEPIRWLTEVVPESHSGEYVSFIWKNWR